MSGGVCLGIGELRGHLGTVVEWITSSVRVKQCGSDVISINCLIRQVAYRL
jgi:hypothetical protein